MSKKTATLSRLIFGVRPDCMVAFEQEFDTELYPILQQLGLTPAQEMGREVAPHIFARLYTHDSIDDLLRVKQILQTGGVWRGIVRKFRDMLVEFAWEGKNDYWRFDPYVVPAGKGRRIHSEGMTYPAGKGKGHWEHFGIEDGLPSVNVMSITADRKGHIWFGTENGLTCFDSRNWRTYTLRDGLPGVRVQAMLEDRDGYLWFAIGDQGVVRFDGNHFEQLEVYQSLIPSIVHDMIQDSEDKFWFATETTGISSYDGEQWISYTTKDGLPHNFVSVVFEDSQKNIWIGTEGGLAKYDPQSNQDAFVSYDIGADWSYRPVNAIVEDQSGCLWVSLRGGLARFRLSPDLSSGVALIKIHTIETDLPCTNIRCVFADDAGTLWFGTQGQGVMKYDGQDFYLLDMVQGVADNFVKVIHKDREGHYWFGTGNGVSRYSGDTFWSLDQADGIPNHTVLSLAQGHDDGIWMGTRGGAAYFDGVQFTVFDVAHGLLGNEVRHIIIDCKGHTWFAVHGGLTHYDGETFTTYTVEDGLPHDQVQFVLEDNRGHIWCVTWQGRAICRYDGETFTTYTLGDGLTSLKLWTVFQDRKGMIWVGGMGGLSCLLENGDAPAFKTYTADDGLAHNEVRNILEDEKGRLWMSTFGGISMYDGDTFTSYGIENGLAHSEFRGLLQDHLGTFWFGTYGAGVNRWRPEFDMPLVQVLADRKGLIGNRILSILEDRSGALWFGTASGITRFIQPNIQPPEVFVEAVVADRRYRDVSELQIPASAEVVAFEFGSVSFKTQFDFMCYRYRLMGFDADWHVTRDERVEYDNLLEGHYTFEVQAFDRDLVGSVAPALVQIDVQPAKEHIAQKLRESKEALVETIAARDQLDARLQELNYLYSLRAKLSEAQTMHDILQCAGTAVAQALDRAGTVTLSLDGQVFTFGKNDGATYVYERSFVWKTRIRGDICVHTFVPLSETQERLLLDQTVAHLIHALEAHELEAQLLQSARLVSMGQMAAGVAHELNQPLGAISNVVSDVFLRLRDGINLSKEDLSQMMQDSMRVVNRMSETINHLRVFSRDEAQTPATLFDVNDVIHSSLKLMGVQLKNHRIDLQLDLQASLPFVLGHAHQMEQVVVNLLANARDAVDVRDDDKCIALCSYLNDATVVVEVHDNGVGIPKENISRVFDPFFTTKEADKGTGLGLSISYAIVKNHKGDIVCDSERGQSTVFCVRLPIQA